MQTQFLKRQLPAPALTEWLNAYNAAQSLGSEHNDAVKLAWAEVYKGWERPAGKPMYQRRKKVAKYSPDQPREPKGTPTGGQFASGNGGAASEPEEEGPWWQREGIWAEWQQEGESVVAWHGTDTAAWEKIKTEGLVIKGPVRRSYEGASVYEDDRGRSIFVADSFDSAENVANWRSAQIGQGTAVIELRIPKSEFDQFKEDFEASGAAYTTKRIPPEWITNVYGSGKGMKWRPVRKADDDFVTRYLVIDLEAPVEKMDPGPSDVHVPTVPRQWRRRRKLVVRFDEVGSTGLKVTKADEKKLYVFRPLLNGDDLHEWAKAQGLKSALPADDMHCTICYSKKSVDWDRWQPDDRTLTIEEGNREIELFDEGAMVLHFDAPALHERWQEFRDGGASYDYDEYKPHVTITYNGPRELPEPYTGPLVFGPEEFREIDGSYEPDDEEMLKGDKPGHPFRGNQYTAGEPGVYQWSDLVHADYNEYLDAVYDPRRSHLPVGYNEWVRRGRPKVVPERDARSTMWGHGVKLKKDDQENTMKHLEHARGSHVEYDLRKDDLDIQDLAVCKLDDDQHIVYGWASVVTVKGEPVIDHQGDIITPATIEKAATEFMKDVRAHGNMHRYAWVIKADDSLERELIKVGTVVHSWPFTHELNKLMGISSPYEGWSVGVHVTDPPIWKMYKDGTLKGFSIGGRGAFEEITKTLGAGASASDWIHDFVHSTNPRFRGKSKKERIRMALGAYYGNKRFDDAEIEKIAAEIK